MVITQATHKENPQANAIRNAARGKTNHRFATSNASWRMATPAETSQRRFMAAAKVLIGIPSARAERLPYPDAAFDLVSCQCSLHHMPHPELALKEMGRVM